MLCTRLFRHCFQVLTTLAFVLSLGLATHVHAFVGSHGEDDTILVEKVPVKKFSYSAAVKAFSKSILKFDIDEFLSGGQNCKDAVVRHFSQLSERTHYRFNLKQDKLEFNLKVNF